MLLFIHLLLEHFSQLCNWGYHLKEHKCELFVTLVISQALQLYWRILDSTKFVYILKLYMCVYLSELLDILSFAGHSIIYFSDVWIIGTCFNILACAALEDIFISLFTPVAVKCLNLYIQSCNSLLMLILYLLTL